MKHKRIVLCGEFRHALRIVVTFFSMLSMVDVKSAVNGAGRTIKRFTFKPAYDSVTNAMVDFL